MGLASSSLPISMQMEWHFAEMELVVVKPVGATALQVDLQQDGSLKIGGCSFHGSFQGQATIHVGEA